MLADVLSLNFFVTCFSLCRARKNRQKCACRPRVHPAGESLSCAAEFSLLSDSRRGSGRKKRCVPRGAGLACELCALKNLTCNLYAPSIGSPSAQEDIRHSQLEHSELQDHVVSALHDEALVAELTDLYFDRIHDKQHILFHQASFEAQYHAGIIADYIILGVMALAAR